MEAIQQWLNTEEYPFKHHYLDIKGHKMHFIDEGEGETLLFVHGTPSWSFDFRKVIKALSRSYRCVAIDHIGFGLSDKPGDYDYTTKNHANTLRQFIQRKELKDITLVVHDFGGPVGFDYALKNPDNVKRFVVMNSWLWSVKEEPEFIKAGKILKSPLLPVLYRYLNFSPKFLLPSSFGERKPSKEILKHYTRPFGKAAERNGTVAFAKSLLNDQDWFEELWQQRDVLLEKPFLFIWGMKDKFVLPKYLDKFAGGFPNSTVKRLQTCGHFPQEEQPDTVIQSMEEWLHHEVLIHHPG